MIDAPILYIASLLLLAVVVVYLTYSLHKLQDEVEENTNMILLLIMERVAEMRKEAEHSDD